MLQGTMAYVAAAFVLIIIIFLVMWLVRQLRGAVSQKEVSKDLLTQRLEAGDMTTPDEQGRTPLMLAAVTGELEVVEMVLEAKPNVNVTTPAGATAMHYAAAFGHIDIARTILRAGAETNPIDIQGRTPLWAAAQQGHVDMVKLLAGRGADVNHPDSIGGITPLMTAAAGGKTKTVSALLDLGADANVTSAGGHTALQYGQETLNQDQKLSVHETKALKVMIKVLNSKTD